MAADEWDERGWDDDLAARVAGWPPDWRCTANNTPIDVSALTDREEGQWPPTVPSVVLAECLSDANENRFLKNCAITDVFPDSLERRAAVLRRMARRGAAVDALVVAYAEPGGTVLTSDPDYLEAPAAYAAEVLIERI